MQPENGKNPVTAGFSSTIEVAVALPLFRTFTYGVPDTLQRLTAPGKRVLVPFGQRRVTGYVLGPASGPAERQLKAVLDVLDEKPSFPSSMISFFRWVADYYFHPIGSVIKTALPPGANWVDVTFLEITPDGHRMIEERRRCAPLERDLLKHLSDNPCSLRDLDRKMEVAPPRALIRSLIHQGLIQENRRLRGGRVKPLQERWLRFKRSAEIEDKLSSVKREILDTIRALEQIPLRELKKRFPQSPRHIASLEKKGLIEVLLRRVYRDPMGEPIAPDTPPVLNREQREVVDAVSASLDLGFSAHLLKGIAGSGKTEVYMHLADKVLRRERKVVVLVPEIALITQIERRFRARFGDCVATLHSGLSAGEQLDQWDRISNGRAAIAVGARSAVFAPFDRVGLMVIDEEHDSSYKQETGLRYNARDVAVVRARQNDAVVLMGSATPSVQSYHNVASGKFNGLRLTHRVRQRPLPDISIVDLRKTRDVRGVGKYFSPELLDALNETLGNGDQALLFLNRRGYASYPVCASCGANLRCKNCDIALTLHLRFNAYRCHYCGFTKPGSTVCPECGSSRILHLGIGTETVEQYVRGMFPAARVVRMDRDTTSRKGAIVKILKDLRNRSIDILVGTQMVTKGHDFPHITMVGVICADLSLSMPDFRAGERTHQLLAQVSGRAGRGELPGRVILQTFNPEHFSIRSAGDQDYEAFYRKEIGFRETLRYPPFSRIIQLIVSGRDKKTTSGHADTLGRACKSLAAGDPPLSGQVEVLGPVEAPLSKIAGYYRWQVLLKGSPVKPFRAFFRRLQKENPALFNSRDAKVVVDVDPYATM